MLTKTKGIIVTSPIIQIIAGGAAGALVVFTIPVLANQLVGTKSAKIRKVMLRNNAAGNTTVLLGTGGVGVGIPAILPALDSMNGLTDCYDSDEDFPEVEVFAATISAWAAALVAAGTIDVQLELEITG